MDENPGDQLPEIVGKAIERFEAAHADREAALRAARLTIQLSSRAIRAAHRREFDEARALAGEARETILPAGEVIRARKEFFDSGMLHDAEKEYAEAVLTIAMLAGEALPGPEELGVGPAPYLNGLAEAASELRRAVLDRLRDGGLPGEGLKEAERLLAIMDDVYVALITVDFPDAVTRGLRRTTDQFRAVLERTRSDLTVAARQLALEEKLDRMADRLG